MRQTEIENGKIENPEPGGSKVINRKSENSKAPNSEFEKSKDGNGEWEIADAGNRENGNGDTAKSKTDLLKNRRLLFPGLTVMAYFTPGHKGGYMMLREMWVKVDEGTLERCKEQWLMESEKPSSAPLPE